MLDQAEIPTAQERGLSARRGAPAQARRGAAAAWRSTVDGRRVRARAGRARRRLSFPAGAGGLPTTPARAGAAGTRRRTRRASSCATTTFPGRVGWKAVVAAPGRGHRRCAARAPERRPHRRPAPLPEGPAEQPGRPARGELQRGARRRDADRAAERGRRALREPRRGDSEGFAHVFEDAASGRGRAAAAAARRLRLGRAPRALAGPRQGDGGRLPGGHPRPPPARGGARRAP